MPIDSEISKTLISFVGGAASAAVAGYFGVRYGLSNARNQRGFERRLEWLENTLKAIHENERAIENLSRILHLASLGKANVSQIMDAFDALRSRIDELTLLFDIGKMYASMEASISINILHLKIMKAGEEQFEQFRALEEKDPLSKERIEHFEAYIQAPREALYNAKQSLIDDAKAHLRTDGLIGVIEQELIRRRKARRARSTSD
jgi:hypothetical protein